MQPPTSVHDGGVAVEDQSALVQGRNRVEQVEGPQVPLSCSQGQGQGDGQGQGRRQGQGQMS